MQTVGAQWLLVDSPNAAALVSLVQVANTLPVMLLALPGGVLADSIGAGYVYRPGILLCRRHPARRTHICRADAAGPAAGFHLRNCDRCSGAAPRLAGHHSRTCAQDAAASGDKIEMVGVNVARAGGPALAGLVIARFGVPWVFALNALSVIFLVIALLLASSVNRIASHPRALCRRAPRRRPLRLA